MDGLVDNRFGREWEALHEGVEPVVEYVTAEQVAHHASLLADYFYQSMLDDVEAG